MTKNCHFCGFPNEDDNVICDNCGKYFNNEQSEDHNLSEQSNILNKSKNESQNKKTPVLITIISGSIFIGSALMAVIILSSISSIIRQNGWWYLLLLGLNSIISLICAIGLLEMKKWAAYTYIGLYVFNMVVHEEMRMIDTRSIIPNYITCNTNNYNIDIY